MEWKQILGLMVLYFVYLCGGAGVFWALEFRHEERICEETTEQLIRTFQKFEKIDQTNGSINRNDVQELVELVLSASDKGVVFNEAQEPHCAHNWYYNNAFFFAGTLVTTIGYGNISPHTRWGKVFCIVYAFVGIPIFGFMFLGIGEKIAAKIGALNERVGKRITKRVWLRQVVVLLTTIFVIHIFFLILPASIFWQVESWSYRDAVYYTYITLTTIGLGDFVAGSNPDIEYWTIYRVLVYFWILFGLAGMATLINVVGDFIKPKAATAGGDKEEDGASCEEGEAPEPIPLAETGDAEAVEKA